MNKKRIGLLGGTFDPPHLGHLIIANEVLDQLNLDQVRFMPNQEPPHKTRTSGTTQEDRIKMLQLAIQGQPQFAIEKIELERTGVSYSIDTMSLLLELYPENEYFFIIGADMVEYLPKWHKIEDLVKIVQFVGVNRPGFQLKSKYPVIFVDVPLIEISSSMIRERCKKGRTINYLVPDPVLDYIEVNRLYGS